MRVLIYFIIIVVGQMREIQPRSFVIKSNLCIVVVKANAKIRLLAVITDTLIPIIGWKVFLGKFVVEKREKDGFVRNIR